MAPRILHTADWQIGKGFGQIPGDDGAALRNQRLETVSALAELATAEHVDAVLVAGDIFDSQSVADRTIRQVFERLRAFSGPWVLLPGNHDAAIAESVWDRAYRLGAISDNVRVATAYEPILLNEAGLAVLPAPLQRRHEPADVTAWFDEADVPAGYIRVGLAHGSVTGFLPADADAANPVASDRAITAGLAYLALGDWHGTLQVDKRTWYSGTPEVDSFSRNDPGHALLVTLSETGSPVEVERRDITRYRWHRLTQALYESSNVAALNERLNLIGEPSTDQVVKLTLSGSLNLADKAELEDMIASWRGRFRYLRIEDEDLITRARESDLAALDGSGFVATAATQLQEGANAGDSIDATALEMLLAAHRHFGKG